MSSSLSSGIESSSEMSWRSLSMDLLRMAVSSSARHNTCGYRVMASAVNGAGDMLRSQSFLAWRRLRLAESAFERIV